MKNQFVLLSVIVAVFTGISQPARTQNSCETAIDATIGTNQASAQSELWYKFSVSGRPLARYHVNYDSKSLNVGCDIFAGTCDNLLGQGSSIPAIEDDDRTYYIRFTWGNGATPQAFEWELSQYLIVPMTGIEVTPSNYNLAFGGSFILDNVFTLNRIPENTTESFLPEYQLIDSEGMIDPPIFQASNTTLTAIGSGTAKLAFFARSWDDYSLLGTDTVTINISAPALCSSATAISAGANTAQDVQEQWFHFTAEKTGIYSINHASETNGNKISVNWSAYAGDCNTLRKQEAVYVENAQFGFNAEAGQIYFIKLYQYGSTTFEFTLESPKNVTGFNLTTKQLELDLYTTYMLEDLGLNFTPADATDKGVTVEVRDPDIIEYREDEQSVIYKDDIYAREEGSTYVVFTTNDGSFKDSCRITVKRIHLTSFQLSLHEKTLWLPYSQNGEYALINDTTELKLLFNPLNATDKSYNVTVRNKGVAGADRYGIWALREGSTYVVFTTNDGYLQDSILIHVTRTTTGGAPCENAAVAQLGENNMPAAEYHTEWFQFTPSETANYALTINVEKYPFTDAEIYKGDCTSLYLVNDGQLGSTHYEDHYGAGFFGEAGKTCYLKLTTRDYNTGGGGVIVPYTWKIVRISASISGTVTGNGAPAQGTVELYSVKKGSALPQQTAAIQADGTYLFDNLGVEDYAIRAVTIGGDITWYGSNTPYFIESAVISLTESGAITGKDIDIVYRETLSEGNAKISGHIVKSEEAAPQNLPSIRRVKLAEGNPAAGVTVFLLRSGESTPITYTTTNSEGYFEFTGVGTGEYRIRVQVAGLETVTTEVSITEDGQNIEIDYEMSETGIEETGETALPTVAATNVRIYPNPVAGILNVAGAENASLTVLNLQGHKVYFRNKLSAQENIPVSSWAKGLYIIHIQTENGKMVKKIVKN
ncbi:MAG: carboxypeptidase regulatory-like domain-containing protein [Dysgonamonadaceae bacterium]|jgi:uncharacterized protein YjdB/5-hydroxyisourate hydrolase-like protein (transthyretin family)|nr:carboxypeptidase regulatory-like domain-containing protein [Dysgonamonadaceae bacterium]